MAGAEGGRAARYAAEFEAAQERLIRRLESLTDEQWRRPGRNYPQRLNQEDERRTVGVIAHHVAIAAPRLLERIQALAEGRPLPPLAPEAVSRDNDRHAAEHAGVTREEVLRLLREQRPRIAAALRAIPDHCLDRSGPSPAGPLTVGERIERVLIGHIDAHLGSIEAALS